MIVGVPKEIKNEEYRVAMTPIGVKVFVNAGHTVVVEAGAGVGSGFSDDAYKAAGAELAPVDEVFARADMIYKVKEPLAVEWPKFKPGQILYTYLHLAAAYAKELTDGVLATGIRAIAFETVETATGGHPLLFPMSEVAGKLAMQAGATHLQKDNGGRGVLIGGVTGVPPAKVVIIGGGTVGTNAARVSVGMGARTVVLDTNAARLTYLDEIFGGRIETVLSNEALVEEEITDADIVVGGVLLPHGAQAPHLVKRSMLKKMQPGSVMVDVAIDQGGCFETSKPTTHTDPDLRGRRRHPLLRRQHARRGGPHVDPRPRRRHAALRPADRHQGLREGRGRRSGAGARRQRVPWQAHDPVGRPGSRHDLHAAGRRHQGLRRARRHKRRGGPGSRPVRRPAGLAPSGVVVNP